jgi:hypothetical protein
MPGNILFNDAQDLPKKSTIDGFSPTMHNTVPALRAAGVRYVSSLLTY